MSRHYRRLDRHLSTFGDRQAEHQPARDEDRQVLLLGARDDRVAGLYLLRNPHKLTRIQLPDSQPVANRRASCQPTAAT
jgi:hypothetical protein